VAQKVPAATGSIVKGFIENATVEVTAFEREVAAVLTNGGMDKGEQRMAYVGILAPSIGRLSYFTREIIRRCFRSELEPKADEVKVGMDAVQKSIFGAIRANDSTVFASSIGQMLIATEVLKQALIELEDLRFENSNMRRE
jgi:hypothetical protein